MTTRPPYVIATPFDDAPSPSPIQAPRIPPHLAIARAELARGVKEIPLGSNDGLEIRLYLAPLRLGPSPWCAAFVCYCLARSGERRLPYTAAVRVLAEAARARGMLRPLSTASVPRLGDLLLMGRDGQDPLRGGAGHVEIVDAASGDGWWCIGGNVSPGCVARTLREPTGEQRIVGWVAL